ncbi:Copper binding proteins, plastocyanin/azurin family [uncultured archaeon]|nr:Copper binding proteins, plastocyanin/azurin family [uncultured archaeon]
MKWVFLVCLVFLCGCLDGSSPQTQQTPSGVADNCSTCVVPAVGAVVNVDVKDFAFSPQDVRVKVNDVVVWTNRDSVPHAIVSDSGGELNSALLNNGETFSHLFKSAEVVNYHCSVHPSMKGTVTVE